ncbi:MAG: HAMP domain-containing histidine kinase [Chloroflexi bacterium]|nr:HAMP domain-containing histidine kinase [Chloroflexota bacterium]
MRLIKDNILLQFSIVSLVAIVAIGAVSITVLTIWLNGGIDLLVRHGDAMDAMANGGPMIQSSDPYSIPSLTDKINQLRWVIIGVFTGGLLLLYISLVNIVRSGWTTIQRQRERLTTRIQEVEEAQEVLKEIDRLKDEFIATVSHEFRTPLTAIKGAAEILITYRDDDEETQMQFLEIIDSESDRLTRLVEDMLDLARIESGQMNWVWEDVDIKSVVGMAVDGTQSLAMQKDLSINVDLEPDLPILWNDRDRLVQVATNLLSNSIKFTPEGGTVSINVKKLDDDSNGLGERVEVCVKDSGIGIQKAKHEIIFKKFEQVNDEYSEKPKGTGLGLHICKEIVERFGGKIWVESTPGEGASFYFTVPVSARELIS